MRTTGHNKNQSDRNKINGRTKNKFYFALNPFLAKISQVCTHAPLKTPNHQTPSTF